MRKIYVLPQLIALTVAIFLISCDTNGEGFFVKRDKKISFQDRVLIPSIKFLSDTEKDKIEYFSKIHKIPFIRDSSNVFKNVEKMGKGLPIEDRDNIKINYIITSLSSDTLLKESSDLVINSSESITALHRALLGVKRGTTLRLIIDPQQAYGLFGNGKIVKGYSYLYFRLEIRD